MTPERYRELDAANKPGDPELTQEELATGWHWCADWDFLLVGPDMPEVECCGCFGPCKMPSPIYNIVS